MDMPIRVRRALAIAASAAFLVAVAGTGYLTLSGSNMSILSQADRPFPGVDFSRDQDANYAAAQGNLYTDLEQFDSYAVAQIVRSGIEVELVGPPTAAIRAVVARDDPLYQGKPIPVSYRSVRHTRRQLQALVERIGADDHYLQQQGIQLSTWGADPDSNLVKITVAHYTKAYRDALIARYGREWVTVDPKDVVVDG
ncbi:MAG TPA: hypothetical protein VFD94_00205 [Jatrophihabitans sp.]|nr:hypothetical protein [Jatrophihabitans sp.]